MTSSSEMIVVNGVRFRPEDKTTDFYKQTVAEGHRQAARRAAKAAKPSNKAAKPSNKTGEDEVESAKE